MNLLDLAIYALLFICLVIGYYHGFIKAALGVAAWGLSILFAMMLWRTMAQDLLASGELLPILLNFSESNDMLLGPEAAYGEALMTGLANMRTPITDLAPNFLEVMASRLIAPLPHPFGALVTETVLARAFVAQGATQLGEYLSLTVAYFTVGVIAFALVFFIFYVISWFAIHLCDATFTYPVLRKLDGLAGASMGLITGYLLLLICGLAIPVAKAFLPVDFLMEMIDSSSFVSWFYANNPLLGLFPGAF